MTNVRKRSRVGVMPPEFRFVYHDNDVWVPLQLDPNAFADAQVRLATAEAQDDKDEISEFTSFIEYFLLAFAGIAIATGTAGIIVGGITLTGLGFRMTDFVEVVSQGNVFAMLLFTAFGNQFWSVRLSEPIAALPLQIFTYAVSPYDEWHALAWAGSLVLIFIVFVISLAARFATRSRFGGMGD